MDLLTIVFCLLVCYSECVNVDQPSDEPDLGIIANSTDPGKDMYVIHAMVYQVGIVTNKTDNETSMKEGDQTSVTIFNTNGSNIDLSELPTPLETNVTAQRLIGVAPVPAEEIPFDKSTLLWNSSSRKIRETSSENDSSTPESDPLSGFEPYYENLFKRSMNPDDDSKDNTRVKLEKGVSTIPQQTGVQSIVIPPLLAFNSNFSEIPVPIPNTSVVQYAKVNTLFNKP